MFCVIETIVTDNGHTSARIVDSKTFDKEVDAFEYVGRIVGGITHSDETAHITGLTGHYFYFDRCDTRHAYQVIEYEMY